MTPRRAPFRIAIGLLAAAACGKGAAPNATAAQGGEEAPAAKQPMDGREADAWARAKGGDDEDRLRLADLLGCVGLRERAEDKELRATAIRAMAFCADFSALAWLASVATTASDGAGLDALATVTDLASRPRRATDPEDGEELYDGCQALLALSRSTDAPRARRVAAIRALRMLADRGCVKTADIPIDFDAK